jgi:hypothetical protein
MRITTHFAFWSSLAFGVVCAAYGLIGLNSLDADVVGTARDDARGFAGFFLFMGGLAFAFAGGAWWMLRHGSDSGDE